MDVLVQFQSLFNLTLLRIWVALETLSMMVVLRLPKLLKSSVIKATIEDSVHWQCNSSSKNARQPWQYTAAEWLLFPLDMPQSRMSVGTEAWATRYQVRRFRRRGLGCPSDLNFISINTKNTSCNNKNKQDASRTWRTSSSNKHSGHRCQMWDMSQPLRNAQNEPHKGLFVLSPSTLNQRDLPSTDHHWDPGARRSCSEHDFVHYCNIRKSYTA